MNVLQLKEWTQFYRRMKTLGVNGLTQESFIKELEKMLVPSSFPFSYKLDQREEVIIGNSMLVADIRKNPHVKRGFRPDQLQNLLEANEMEYIRYKHLGNPFYKEHLNKEKAIREKFKDNPTTLRRVLNAHLRKAKRQYQNYVLSDNDARQELHALFNQFRKRQMTCMICYCKETERRESKEPLRCHRFWLKDLFELLKKIKLKFEGYSMELIHSLQEVNH